MDYGPGRLHSGSSLSGLPRKLYGSNTKTEYSSGWLKPIKKWRWLAKPVSIFLLTRLALQLSPIYPCL